MKALILNAEQRTAHVQEVAQPIPGPKELLIHVHNVALNPIDSIYVLNPLGKTGRTVGSDFAGTIITLGAEVPSNGSATLSSGLGPGKRVSGFLQGACSANERPGAFAEHVVCSWDLVWEIPEEMALEKAATMSLCGLTAAQAVFFRLGLEAPFFWPGPQRSASNHDENNRETLYFFIYGASTTVGQYAAELVRRSAEVSGKKIKLLGAASKKNFGMLEREPFGYDHLVDYGDQDWPDQIRKLSGGVQYAYDCISEGLTVQKVCSTLQKNGQVAIVRSRAAGAWTGSDLPIEPIYGAVWEGLGVEIQYQGFVVPASPEARAFAVAFYKWLSDGGRLQPSTVRLMPGGLEKIVDDGFTLLGPGTMESRKHERTESWMKPVSAEKLVYQIAQ